MAVSQKSKNESVKEARNKKQESVEAPVISREMEKDAGAIDGEGLDAAIPDAGISPTIALGRRGEAAAACYLERNGIEILDRNWTCKYGEADIVAREDDDIVFVEVKTRTNIDKGIPEDAITASKRDRYEKIAASYLRDHAYADCYVRFDVIGILVVDEAEGRGRALLRHHRSAFAQAN